ncbi:MAG: Chromatin structure-remodeling complex protein rsc9 [Vezdaea aestivalis]|nr:MAG: Chromatin structure-remodeling complex protein rsc9 [Vezdaea aestivalis]
MVLPTRSESIERTQEYVDFIASVDAFHQARGTPFDREPKVGSRHVDLLRLFNLVMSKGGYDKVSAEKLAWRTVGLEFSLGHSNLPALAFNLKTVFYKNLAAYEISTIHGKVPPPREILEDLTARGGDLLNRTLDNYKPPGNKDHSHLANGDDSDGSGNNTPKVERGSEEPGTGSRATRGLRQAPPQRVLFQPEITTRQPRNTSNYNASAQSAAASAAQTALARAAASASYLASEANPLNSNFKPDIYQSRGLPTIGVRAISTPLSDPSSIRERTHQLLERRRAQAPDPYRGVTMPGTGFNGPNIYHRILMSLRSSIQAEVGFALHHMVKISYERGDKYKFEQFPGLAEGLMEMVLAAFSAFTWKPWQISYSAYGSGPNSQLEVNELDGLYNIPDIVDRIAANSVTSYETNFIDDALALKVGYGTEASLVLRNLGLLEENARFLADIKIMRDVMTIALCSKGYPSTTEMTQNMLELAEQVTKHLEFPAVEERDGLRQALLLGLRSSDRGTVLSSLRALSRASMNVDTSADSNASGCVELIEPAVLEGVSHWLLLYDDDLVYASLDFLYQYTSKASSVETLITKLNAPALVQNVARLLSHNSRSYEESRLVKNAKKAKPPTEAPVLPEELIKRLAGLEEPLRSSMWLKSSFAQDYDAHITQLQLWQLYSNCFAAYDARDPAKNRMAAAEFIKNVGVTFGDKFAKAEVVQENGVASYIIRGIRFRRKPIGPDGNEYIKCWWQEPDSPGLVGSSLHICGLFCPDKESLYFHIMSAHLDYSQHDDGNWSPPKLPGKVYHCEWHGCTRWSTEGRLTPQILALHIRQHLPDEHKIDAHDYDGSAGAKYETIYHWETSSEPRKDARGRIQRLPKGVPLGAALVLINIAKAVRELPPPIGGQENLDLLFTRVKAQVWDSCANNRTLATQMSELVELFS